MEILNHPYFIVVIVACIGVEYLISRKRGTANFNLYETASSLGIVCFDKAIAYFTGTDGGPLVKILWSHRLLDWDFGPIGNFVLTLLAVEFMYYCNHWYNHYVNIGWATHIMHHSPTKYNLTLGYRLGITRLFSLGWMVVFPFILLGFHPEDLALSLGMILLVQFFIHTELVPSLGILDKVFNTPSNHRVHHSSDPRFFNKNLGGLTMIFDHLFGTYQADDKGTAMEYGIPSVMEKKNIWHEITCHWALVFRAFRRASGPKRKFLALFGPADQM